jgi:hypothetical protein
MNLPDTPQRTDINFVISTFKRAVMEEIADRRFSQQEKLEVIRRLQMEKVECAYCGSNALVKSWDHLVAIKYGGDTVFGNLVPVCTSCNSSKGDKNYEHWMLSDVEASPKNKIGEDNVRVRLNRIANYVTASRYKPKSLEHRFTKSDFKKIAIQRDKIESLLSKLQSFIAVSKKCKS